MISTSESCSSRRTRIADLLCSRSDDDDEDAAPAAEGAAPAENHEKEKAPKLEAELRQWSVEEIAEFDVKLLKAKISALEGESHC